MKSVNQALLLAMSAFINGPVLALETDSKQPMYIEADSATYDEGKGITEYRGNVRYSQGSIESQSDKMIVYQKDGKTDKVEAFGKPTRIKQTPEADKPDWHGIGLRSEYFPETGILILYEKALAWQGDNPETSNRVSSERIQYDIKNSVMKAGVPSGRGDRVKVTLQPEKDDSPK
jgi:lipopolysaccharide export system protein LptA